jgi:hypothetical protein
MSKLFQAPVYDTLGPNEIRLLTLHYGNAEDPIRCSLRHAELKIKQRVSNDLVLHKLETNSILRKIKTRLEPRNQPKFEALSYCWGLYELYNSIEINEQQIPVRRNLW